MSENNEQMIPTPSDFGHFLLEKELGHGGMGGVYLARDKMLDRKVGIKVMLKSLGDDPVFLERFQREAQAAARLNHPNIAQIYSFGMEQGMPYIAMELVSGGSLDKEMADNPGTMDPVRVMRIGLQMAEALAVAADQGLVHGDVKPENVLFDADGNAKLVDFGLAAMQADSDEIWGTPYYISPEKVKRQKIDFRADIYSLGGTLYHALTGVAPFEGDDATAVVKARFDGPPKLPSEVRPDLPKDIDAIIMRMLEVEPSMRYPTYQSLVGDIKRFVAKAGPVRTSRIASGKLKIKGTKIKLKASAPAPVTEESGEAQPGDATPRLQPLVAEAPKKSTNVGAMVGLVVGIVIVVVLCVVGGLVWYVHADKASQQKDEIAQTIGTINKARAAIAETVKTATEYGDNFHERMAAGEKIMNDAARRMRTKLPSEFRAAGEALLTPVPAKDVADAIAYTNKLLSAGTADVKKPEAAKPEAAKADGKKADGKKADAPQEKKPEQKKPAAPVGSEASEEAAAARAMAEQEARVTGKPLPKDEKKAEAPVKEKDKEKKPAEAAPAATPNAAVQLPSTLSAVKKFGTQWASIAICQAADIRVQGHVVQIKRLAEQAKNYTGTDMETAQKLAEISRQVYEAYETMVGLKCVEDARRKADTFSRTAQSLVKEADRQLTNFSVQQDAQRVKAKEEAERKRKADEEKARQEKARVEEPKQADAKFVELAASRLKTLDWDPALGQLRPLKEIFISPEGRDAAESQIRKVEAMKALQEQFILHGKGFKFLDGTTIKAIDKKEIALQRMKTVKGHMEPDRVVKVEWTRFYGKTEYISYMNQLINNLVLKGRDTTKIGPLAWSTDMLGAALTLKYLYAEVPGADKMAATLVQKAAKEFGDCAKWAKLWFPDVEIEMPVE